MFGKLIDGKLICADDYFIHGDEVNFDLNSDLLKQYGYKEIVFSSPPIVNECVGLSCEYSEDEEKIYQKWIINSIRNDSSSDYFVMISKKIERLNLISTEFVEDYKKNIEHIKKIKNQYPWLFAIYEKWIELPEEEKKFTSNIVEYTTRHNMDSLILDFDYVKKDSIYVKKEYENSYEKLSFKDKSDIIIDLCFIKSNITLMDDLITHNSFENEVKNHMLYQYMVVVFDDFLMDTIKLIYNFNRKSLCSNKMISYEEIIKAGNYDNLINILIDKTVTLDGFDNLVTKLDFLEKKGISIEYPNNYTIKDVWVINEIRNCIVHNQGIMSGISHNRLVSNKVKFADKYKPGDKLNINKRFEKDLKFLVEVIKLISKKICDKYNFLFRFFL